MAALEVLALNTVIPQIQAPQVGDTYLFPRAAEFSAGTALLPSLAATGDLDTGMWFPAANTVAWSTGGTERMRINATGEVGIGKTAATGIALDVNGPIHLTNRVQLTNGFASVSMLESASGIGYRWVLANNGTYRLQRTANGTYSDATTPIIFGATDNVGIGTTNPQSKVHIASVSEILRLESSAATGDNYIGFWTSSARRGWIGFGAIASNELSITNQENADVVVLTNNQERMRVKSGGQVRFFPLAAAPTANVQDGDVYYDSGTNKLRVRAGGAWADLN
jgi:hypothetical protein